MHVIRWGLIGAGDIVQKRVAAALRDAPASELTAIARARPELAESFARTLGARRWHRDATGLLADREIDAVYIATPVHLHAAQTIAAAEAGKHVLCEKPMALDVRECDRMIAACRAHDVRLGVAYYRHFYPVIARIKTIVASGEIGDPVVAQIEAFEWCDLKATQPRGWFMKKAEAGGGPMFDFGCHRLEVFIDLFGPVRRVTSTVANVVFDREVEDTAIASLQFARGTCATLAVTHAAIESRDTLRIFGTRGSIHVETLNHGDLRIVAGGQERREAHPPAANLHQPLIEDFVQAICTRREPTVTGDIGRAVAAVEADIYNRCA